MSDGMRNTLPLEKKKGRSAEDEEQAQVLLQRIEKIYGYLISPDTCP
jgi:hypothetical protein